MTIKERKLVQAKAQGKTHAQAYDYAYNPPPTTSKETKVSNTQKVLSRPHVKAELEKALAAHDINLLNAIKPISDALKYVDPESEKETIETQLKGSDRALKLLGVTDKNQSPSLHLHLHKQAEEYEL